MATVVASFPHLERRACAAPATLARRAPESRAHLREAFALLLEAYEYAAELGQDVWSFAVELPVLRAAKLSNSDIRWLSMMGYVKHALETTGIDDAERRFRRTGPILFVDKTCFVCSESGVAVARRMCGKPEAPAVAAPEARLGGASRREDRARAPVWDQQRRQIRVGESVVKEFKLPAPNQETILTAFEEEGWPPRIDDPLPPVPDVDPRRRLHDTIKALNRKQRNDLVRFMGDGNGQGIRWELRPTKLSARSSSAETSSDCSPVQHTDDPHVGRAIPQTSPTARLG